ncbi:CLUMA_CG002125, isoform A [Clunio marinus]|uniref:Ubiquinone biosynthesis protein n=1 Tax=Clunio marinus TaxID=568069 RepID=A0A1J1HK96_9DIPT|nr:CLUMA_CG002125, isoform A [Clunio marinus]
MTASSLNASKSQNRKLQNVNKSHKICSRLLSVPSLVLYAEQKNLDDFRAREEQKEAEFNKQPIENENEKENEEKTEDDEEVMEIKNKILEASLAFVTANGWTRQAIVKGAEQAGYPGTVHGMFPSGGIELINFYYLKCNKDLVVQMREKVGEKSEKVGDPKEFVCWALKERLLMLDPYIKTWPQALAMMSLPPNVPTSLANMLTLVDDICYYSGDRSIDFNWYARRIGLATIYKATELYMLQDSSPQYESTWKFLQRRIADASLVHDVLIQSEGATQHLTQAVTSAFTTARNILGLNFERR